MDQGASLSDGSLEFQSTDPGFHAGMVLNHFQGGIAAPIQDDDDLPPTPMVLGKILGISGQGLANAVLFIVSRYQQGQAR